MSMTLPITNKPLSNEQWAIALHLFAQLVDGADPVRLIAGETDPGIRAALENLWRQHQYAEKIRFLDGDLTVVNKLGAPGPIAFQPGQILADRFAILRLLGRGGMGEVYLADDRRLSETVALKTIKREFAMNKADRDRFLNEVQNSRRVTHPNVCRIFDLFEHDDVPFYSMEYIAGPTLAEVLAAGPLKLERVKWLAVQGAEALAAAHRNGVLHCDLKPANILLFGSGKNERAVITDFGLARALGRSDLPCQTQIAGGTPPYMAPELLKGECASIRTDIYAFGKVLDAMLPGNKLAPDCLSADPTRRPASVEEVLERLRGKASTSRRTWIGGLMLGAAGSAFYLHDRSRPRIPLGSRQRIRVNGFNPASGDTARIVRNLLVMALRQSPLLSVVGDRTYLDPDGGKPLTAGISFPLADLLSSARKEKVNLVVDSDLETVGAGLRLKIKVYDAASSALLYKTAKEVPSQHGLVQLAELAATDLRTSAFGESTPHASYVPLEQVTSASPEAVDYYFQAVFAYENSDAATALVLLDRALKLDPDFALAHHYRALALSAKRMMESAEASEEIAFTQRIRVSERERNWIESQYYNIVGAWSESAAALRKNTVLFPDEALFERQLAFALTRLGLYDEAITHNRRSVELDPFNGNNASELLMNLAEANNVNDCLAEANALNAAVRTPSLIHSDLALAFLQQGDYDRSLAESEELGVGTAGRESWSRLLSLSPLIMQGRFTEAIQWIEGDLALDSARPTGDREETRTYMRRNALGHLSRLTDASDTAAEQAEFLVNLRPLGANLIPLREGCALALDLNELALAEKGLDRLQKVAARSPSNHSQSAVWLTQAMLRNAQGETGAAELFAKAKGAWPDPLNLFYVAIWEGETKLYEAQLSSLTELERLRGKVYKHHFAGLVVLGWLEQAKCLQNLSRLDESLRMYQRVVKHWGGPQAVGSLMHQTHLDLNKLKGRRQ